MHNYIFLGFIGDWGLGIGDWGLGIGDWAQSPIPINYIFFKILHILTFEIIYLIFIK
jgi:hypothetical protein